jgi:hypothetical protein
VRNLCAPLICEEERKLKMLQMCLTWKVLAGLAAVGVGTYLIAPDLVVAALPVLLLLACPLSMMLMMRSMQQPQGQGRQVTREPDVEPVDGERVARLRAQRETLDDRIRALEREEVHSHEKERAR